MAFGLSPNYADYISQDHLSTEQFIALSVETARRLHWNVGHISPNGFVAYTPFSMRSTSEEVKITLENQLATIQSRCTGNQLMDWGKNKRNVAAFIQAFEETKVSLSPEVQQEVNNSLKPVLITGEDTVLNTTPLSTRENTTSLLSIFIPKPGFFITPLLIDLNLLLFLLMVMSGVSVWLPDTESLLKWGANFKPVTLEGEWWRLLSCCFLHIGILHLLMNMYALLYIGLLLEPYLGKTRFLAAYLLTGIASSVTSIWWHDLTVSAGASGAIFGLYGVFLAMLTTNLIEKSARKTFLTSIMVFVGYNLLNGLKGGIDNAAHIGGLVSGLLIGYAYYPSLKNADAVQLKFRTIALLGVFVLGSSFAFYQGSSNDIGKYEAGMKHFAAMEAMALHVFRMPQGTPKDSLLAEIQDRGLYFWQENEKLVKELDALNLPEPLHQRNRKVLQYCELRKQSFELLYKAIQEGSDQYQSKLEYYNQQLEAIIKELSNGK